MLMLARPPGAEPSPHVHQTQPSDRVSVAWVCRRSRRPSPPVGGVPVAVGIFGIWPRGSHFCTLGIWGLVILCGGNSWALLDV